MRTGGGPFGGGPSADSSDASSLSSPAALSSSCSVNSYKMYKEWPKNILFLGVNLATVNATSGSAMAEGQRDALVSRNSATTKHPI